jgi:hypothetical protein
MQASTLMLTTILSVSALLGYASYALATENNTIQNVLTPDPSAVRNDSNEERILLPGKIIDSDIDGSAPTRASP